MVPRLERRFFERYTPNVAKALLGTALVRRVDGERLSGTIVETEAYRGKRDPASHAFRGRTARNAVMFEQAGHAYVYFAYGSNWCLNITTEPAGTPGAVLIRAIEPKEGLEAMAKNRRGATGHLTDGPGRLTQALGIDANFDGEDFVTSSRLFLEYGRSIGKTGVSPRVGISRGTSYMWRFFVIGNAFVSRAKFPVRPRTHN